MKAFALIKMNNGAPDIDPAMYHGFVFCDRIGPWGAYLVSGTGPQLQAIANLGLSTVIPICVVTEGGAIRWAELDVVISEAQRSQINDWLQNRDLPTIPAGWTYRQVVVAVYRRLNAHFDLGWFDVADVPQEV